MFCDSTRTVINWLVSSNSYEFASKDVYPTEFTDGDFDFSKSFQDTAVPGDTVTLNFTIANVGSGEESSLEFSDNLFSGPSRSDSDLTPPDTYVNTTGDLNQDVDGQRFPVANPAVASLVVTNPPADSDGDTVLDVDDLCPTTGIPEAGVPTQGLGTNRLALGPFNDDTIFDTNAPGEKGGLQNSEVDIQQTAGCSCEQLIAEMSLGQGHTKFGCSGGAVKDWIELVGGGN